MSDFDQASIIRKPASSAVSTTDVTATSVIQDNEIARGDGGARGIQGSGITIADGASGTLAGTNSGDQSIFSTIAVSGQSNVVADTTSDTLTLVAGTNITITTDASADSVTITAASGGGMTWNIEAGTSATMAVANGYISNNASLVTFTLPTTAAAGDSVRVTGIGAGGWKIAQNASEQIHFGNQSTTSGTGGSLASTHKRDAVELICVVANNEWNLISSIGNITVV